LIGRSFGSYNGSTDDVRQQADREEEAGDPGNVQVRLLAAQQA